MAADEAAPARGCATPSLIPTIDARNVRRALALLAVPTSASIVGDQLLGIADTIVIGTLGPAALAAMTGATSVFIALVLALHGLSQGAGILGAQAIGAGDAERLGRIARAAVLIPTVVGIGVIAAAMIGARPAIRALIGPLPTVGVAAEYLTFRCWSIIAVVISGIAYTIFTAAGDARFGLNLLVVVNVVHLPLLVILALGWGTHHPLGIPGAGISSLCAESVGALYALAAAWRRPDMRIFTQRGIDRRLALRIAWLGLPEAVYLFLIVAPDIAVVAILAPLGPQAVAAFRVIMMVSDVTWAVPGSLGTAVQTVIGQRLGAGDIGGARRFDRRALRYGVILSTACGIVVAGLAWPIGFICTLDAGLASLAALPLAVQMLTLPLKGYAMIGIARVRASGDTRFSMIVGIIASAIDIPGTWFALHVLHLGLVAVPVAWIVAWLFWCGATMLRLRRFDWKTARLVPDPTPAVL